MNLFDVLLTGVPNTSALLKSADQKASKKTPKSAILLFGGCGLSLTDRLVLLSSFVSLLYPHFFHIVHVEKIPIPLHGMIE